MKTSREALVKPELLVWARKSSRLDVEQAARKIGTTRERLEQWEEGKTRPSIPQLRKMAGVYRRPLAVFYLPEPPSKLGFDAMRDFRRLPEAEQGISSTLAFELRRAEERRQNAMDLAGDSNMQASLPHLITTDMSPVEAGDKVRGFLGVSIEQQFKWRDRHQAFNAWKDAVESKGILVFQTADLPLHEMRGAAIGVDVFPVILLNGKDYPNGKTFTLLHELAHILLKQSGICDLQEWGPMKKLEVFCNAVAGNALVPAQSLLENETVKCHDPLVQWTDSEIRSLSSRFSVSDEALVRRLTTLALATEEFYQKKREEYLRIFEDTQQREKERQKAMKSHPPRFRMVIRNNGKRYTRMVIEAYLDDSITASDVADYLEMKLKHLPKIEEALLGAKTSKAWD